MPLPIPLTFAAMQGSRPLSRGSVRPLLGLLSALVLLACASFPVAAQAETVYDPESPNIPEEKPHNNGSNNGNGQSSPESDAKKSQVTPGAPEDGGGDSGGTPVAEDETEDKSTGQGKAGNGSDDAQKSATGVEDQAIADASGTPKASPSSDGDDSSSSPLVSILIAIAVLAAVSIGFVVYRQRHGGADDSTAPKAS